MWEWVEEGISEEGEEDSVVVIGDGECFDELWW